MSYPLTLRMPLIEEARRQTYARMPRAAPALHKQHGTDHTYDAVGRRHVHAPPPRPLRWSVGSHAGGEGTQAGFGLPQRHRPGGGGAEGNGHQKLYNDPLTGRTPGVPTAGLC